jgi:SH3 domain protein
MSRMFIGKVISMVFLIVVFIVSTSIDSVFADTRYVSDRLIISVRDGQDPNAAVLGYIQTAAPVEVLEEKEDFLKIRTSDGIEGWVRAQYIVSDTPKALIIENLRNEITMLNEELAALKNNQNSASNTLLETRQLHQKSIEELKKEVNISQELAAKAKSDFIQLDKKYADLLKQSKNTKELISEVERLKNSNTELNAEVENLRKDRINPLKSDRIQSFIAGAGVLFIGFIIGASAKKKKKTRFI